MIWDAPYSKSFSAKYGPWPSEQGMGRTPSASQNPEEHFKTHDPPELSLHPSKPTTPKPHLLIIDHYQDWQAALYSVTGEAKSSTAQILSTARRLATFSLKLLADVDLNVDPPPKHLTRTLSAAETSLSELSHHMQDLMGNDPLDYGPLGMEMGYRKGTKELADPKNLEHDQDTIEELIQKVRSKLQIMDAQKSSLKSNPLQDAGL